MSILGDALMNIDASVNIQGTVDLSQEVAAGTQTCASIINGLDGIIGALGCYNESSDPNSPLSKSMEDLKMQFVNFEYEEKQFSQLLMELAQLCDPNTNVTDSHAEKTYANENASKVVKNGVVELLTSICGKLSNNVNASKVIIAILAALTYLLRDVQSVETFHKCEGPDIIVGILRRDTQNAKLFNACFSVIAAAATRNETFKESFIKLKLDQVLIKALKGHNMGNIPSLCDAIRILVTPDDDRVAVCKVHGYARQFAKVGIAEALVDFLHEGLTSPTYVSACGALKGICASIGNDSI